MSTSDQETITVPTIDSQPEGSSSTEDEETRLKSAGMGCTLGSQCESSHCRDEVCCETACTGACRACAETFTNEPDGVCASVVSGVDPYDDCRAESPGSCGNDGGCDSQGSSAPLQDQGTQCSSNAQCTSGSCRDGVCCESACSLTCQACSAATTGLANGICGARTASASKPCTTGGTTSCIDVSSDENNCGTCGNVCSGSSLPGTEPVCSASTCSVACPAGTLGDGIHVCIPVNTVAAGAAAFACGLQSEGHVKCWGNLSGLNPAGLSNMLFASITAGSDFMCGIRDTGAAYCWGDNAPAAKSGTFYALAAGQEHVCGIKADRSLDCWTRASDGTDSPPTGTYQWIASGTDFSCAIVQGGNFNGRGWCWGTGNLSENNFPSTSNMQTYAQLFGTQLGGWAVFSDGAVTSWGIERFSPPSGTRFKTIAPGIARDRCGIVDAGTATCWGQPDSLVTSPPSGTFTAIAVGGSHACGVKSDGQLVCWGSNDRGQAPASVAGTFQGYW